DSASTRRRLIPPPPGDQRKCSAKALFQRGFIRATPTNNDAETALRHAVIARRISFGTRTDEGSRAYAAILSVVETCRRRKLDPWALITEAVANARRGVQTSMLPAPMLPT